MSFGKQLKKARVDKGFSQIDFAKKIGLTQASISQFESGAREPACDVIQQFAKILGVSPSLLTGDEYTFELNRLNSGVKGWSADKLRKLNEIIDMINSNKK